MRGHPEAVRVRLLPTVGRRSLSAWITRVKRRRRSNSEERLEVIERLAREERRARRSGDYIPNLGSTRPWC